MLKKLAIQLICLLGLVSTFVSAQGNQPTSWKFQKDQDNKCVAQNLANPGLELMAQKLTITTKETSDLKSYVVSVNDQTVVPMSRVNLTDTACKCIRIRNMGALAANDLKIRIQGQTTSDKPVELALNVKDGELVHLTSKRGSIVAPAQTSHELAPQQAFMAMHWGPAFISGRDHRNNALAGVNAITTSAFCPSSKQPELKHAAVKILKAELPWKLLAMAWLPTDRALTILQSLRQQMVHFEFASCVPFAEELPLATTELSATSASVVPRQGVLFRAASSEAPDMHLVQTLEALLQLDAKSGLRYADPKRSHLRSIQLDRSKDMPQLEAFVMAGDTSAEAWLKTLLQTQQSTESYGRRLLMTGQKPPVALKEAGQTICTCVGVKDVAIAEWLQSNPGQEAAQLAGLQNNLKCGTQCGSCVPQLKRIIALQSDEKPKQDTASLAI